MGAVWEGLPVVPHIGWLKACRSRSCDVGSVTSGVVSITPVVRFRGSNVGS
jgi:hypothetical protein